MEFDLDAALQRFPLPEGIDDALVNRGTLARALNVSEPSVSRFMDEGMPVRSRGSNGQAYEFQLSECYAWRMWRDEEKAARLAAGDRAAAQMSLLFRNDGEPEDDAPVLTAKQIAEEADADYRRQRAAELRGELTRTSKVRELLEDLLVEFRRSITTIPDFCEVEFGLTAAQVDALQRRCDETLESAKVKIRSTLVERPAGEVRRLRDAEQDALPV